MYIIVFLVPSNHVENVKNAMFHVGAGEVGDYKNCSWQALGEGQFMPLKNSNPFIGEKNKINKVPEFYVQMVCNADKIESAITALKNAHPYEEPAYYVIKPENF